MSETTHRTETAPPAWTTRKERGNLFGLSVMRSLSLVLGRPATRPILYLIAAYFLVASPTARQASRQFLARALNRKPGIGDLFRHFLCFATTIHDRLFMLNDCAGTFSITIEGRDTFDRMQAEQPGMFLFGGHLGSFEAIRAAARLNTDLPVSLAMYEENARRLNAVLAAINPALAPDIIPLGQLDSMLTVHQRLQDGALVGILADRAVGPDSYEKVDFLGAPASFPLGPFRMAALLKQPVFFMCGLFEGGNRYRVHLELLADFRQTERGERSQAVSEAVRRYAKTLERHCRAHPDNWFNFFDFWETPRDAKP